MAQQQQVLVLTDGEKLAILIGRDGRDISEIAAIWGKTRVQIWRYQSAEKLKPIVVKRACEILGVQESIFDARLNADSLLRELDGLRRDIDRVSAEVQEEKATNRALIERVQSLEAENRKLKILQN